MMSWGDARLVCSRVVYCVPVLGENAREFFGLFTLDDVKYWQVLPLGTKVDDRPTYKDQHARIIIMFRRTISDDTPATFTQTVLPPLTTSPCSRAADHTFWEIWPGQSLRFFFERRAIQKLDAFSGFVPRNAIPFTNDVVPEWSATWT